MADSFEPKPDSELPFMGLGSRAAVQEKVGQFLAGLSHRKEEMRRRRRTVPQTRAQTILPDPRSHPQPQANTHPTSALV